MFVFINHKILIKKNNYWAEIKKTNSLIMKCIIEYIFHYLGEDL